MTVGEIINKYRTGMGLTQKQLADMVHVSPELVSKWENGSRTPDLCSISAMAEIFGVPEDELAEAGSRTLDELRGAVPVGIGAGEIAGLLDSFLGSLPEKDRNIFVMRYYFFEDTKTIAEQVGITDGAVRVRLFRIRSRLKSLARRITHEKL